MERVTDQQWAHSRKVPEVSGARNFPASWPMATYVQTTAIRSIGKARALKSMTIHA
jgi:hypothetical protein